MNHKHHSKSSNFLCRILLLLLFAALPFASSAQFASVITDQDDYVPGDTVVITGEQWLPGETVLLVITDDSVANSNDTLYAIADASGNIYNNDFIIQVYHVQHSFTLTATG